MLEYLKELRQDIYPQPEDEVHAQWASETIDGWKRWIRQCRSVLDVGCGVAFVQDAFTKFGLEYVGITLNKKDYEESIELGRHIILADFHNLIDFPPFDLIFARHSLEHSPMPLLALMEWHRVCSKYLGLVLPNPEYWGWGGRNHYSVMNELQARFLIDRAGFDVLDYSETEHELRFLCEKKERPVPFYPEE